MLKKWFWVPSFLLLILSNCALTQSPADNGTKQLGNLGACSLTINLVGAKSIQKDIISVQTNQIIGANLFLTCSNNSYSTNWAPGGASSYTYQALNVGAYTLAVSSWDNAGHSNYSSVIINLQFGNNYSVNVLLGGQIYISNSGISQMTEFNDNFESYTLGSNPTSVYDYFSEGSVPTSIVGWMDYNIQSRKSAIWFESNWISSLC